MGQPSHRIAASPSDRRHASGDNSWSHRLQCALQAGVAIVFPAIAAFLLVEPAGAADGEWAHAWSIHVTDPVMELRRPSEVAISPDGQRVYVADRHNHRVVVHDRAGRVQGMWGGHGSAAGRLAYPSGIDVMPDGNVVVADRDNHRLQVFTPEGRSIAVWGNDDAQSVLFDIGPTAIAAAGDGSVYADNGRSIHRFGPAGELMATWDTRLQSPPMTGVDATAKPSFEGIRGGPLRATAPMTSYQVLGQSLAALPDGSVVGGELSTITRYGRDGEVLGRFGRSGLKPGTFRGIRGIAGTPDGTLLVADGSSEHGRVQEFTLGGDFIREIHIAGSYAGDVAVAPDGEIYVAVPNAIDWRGREEFAAGGVIRMSAEGHIMEHWGSRGSQRSLRDGVPRIAIGQGGDVLVSDPAHNRIQRFAPDGRMLRPRGGPGSAAGRFAEPRGIATKGDGSAFIADRGNHRIQHLDSEGRVIRMWGDQGTAPAGFEGLDDLTIGRSSITGYTLLYATNHGPRPLLGFDLYGFFVDVLTYDLVGLDAVGTLAGLSGEGSSGLAATDIQRDTVHWARSRHHGETGGPGSRPGEFMDPLGVEHDHRNLWVADTGNHRLQRFDRWGMSLEHSATIGSHGSELGRFDRPTDLVFDADGNLLVVDAGNARVQRLSPDGMPLSSWPLQSIDEGRFVFGHEAPHPEGGFIAHAFNSPWIDRFDHRGRFVERHWLPDEVNTGRSPSYFVVDIAVGSDGTIWTLMAGRYDSGPPAGRSLSVWRLDRSGGIERRFDVGTHSDGETHLALGEGHLFVLWRQGDDDEATLSRYGYDGDEQRRWTFPEDTADPSPEFVDARPGVPLTLVSMDDGLAWSQSVAGDMTTPWEVPNDAETIALGPDGQLFIAVEDQPRIELVARSGDVVASIRTEETCAGPRSTTYSRRWSLEPRHLVATDSGELMVLWRDRQCVDAYVAVNEGSAEHDEWRLEYFANPHLAERPRAVVEVDAIHQSIDWSDPADGRVPVDSYSVRAMRQLIADRPATLVLTATYGGGLRAWVSDQLIIDEPMPLLDRAEDGDGTGAGRGSVTQTTMVELPSGIHRVVLEYSRPVDIDVPHLEVVHSWLPAGSSPTATPTTSPTVSATESPTVIPGIRDRLYLPRVGNGREAR